jgi:predicted DNA binding CopG/RHH family protein
MKKEYDLRKLTPGAGKTKSAPHAAKIAVSIRLDGSVLAELRTEAHRLGIPYQTLIGSILHRYAHGDLIDPKAAKLDRPVKRAS